LKEVDTYLSSLACCLTAYDCDMPFRGEGIGFIVIRKSS